MESVGKNLRRAYDYSPDLGDAAGIVLDGGIQRNWVNFTPTSEVAANRGKLLKTGVFFSENA